MSPTGGAGGTHHNAIANAFFATLETLPLERHRFIDRGTARLALFDHFEERATRIVGTQRFCTARPWS